MKLYNFTFYLITQELKVMEGYRPSIWCDEDNTYLLPCEFKQVIMLADYYIVDLVIAEDRKYDNVHYLGKKFLFGHPGRIIGYGILNK